MTRGRSRHPHHELACIWLLRDPRTTVWVAWHPCIPTSPSRWCGALDSAVIPAFAAHAQHSSLTRTTPAGMLLCYTLPGRRIPPAGAPRTAAGWKNTATVSPHPGSSVSLPFFSHPCGPAPPYPPSSTFSCMLSRCSVAPRCAHPPLTLPRQSTLRRFASPCSCTCTCATSARLLTTRRVPLMSGSAHTTVGAVLNPPRGGWGGRPVIALLLSQHLNEFIYVNKNEGLCAGSLAPRPPSV